jgi:hypothetical protein
LATDIRPRIEKYVKEDPQFGVWDPGEGKSQAHIRSLEIPCIGGEPSLLLYKLGQMRYPSLDDHISSLFNPHLA